MVTCPETITRTTLLCDNGACFRYSSVGASDAAWYPRGSRVSSDDRGSLSAYFRLGTSPCSQQHTMPAPPTFNGYPGLTTSVRPANAIFLCAAVAENSRRFRLRYLCIRSSGFGMGSLKIVASTFPTSSVSSACLLGDSASVAAIRFPCVVAVAVAV